MAVDPKLQKKLQPFNTIEDFKVKFFNDPPVYSLIFFRRCFIRPRSLVLTERGAATLAQDLVMEVLELKSTGNMFTPDWVDFNPCLQ